MLRGSPAVLTALTVALLCPMALGQYPSELVGFNGPPTDDPNTCQEMFRLPQFSGTTAAYILPNVAGFDNNAAYRAQGLQTEGIAALEVFFKWVNPADPNAWLRLTTFDGPTWPNPALDTRGKVRFRISNRSEFFQGRVGVCIGIRETGGAGIPQLANAGVTGPIEWVGATGKHYTDPNNTIPVPEPAAWIPIGNGFLLEFDLATGIVKLDNVSQGGGIVGFTGDGVMNAPDFRGTLEHIAFVNDTADAAVLIDVAIDELQFEATVPDPTPPPSIQAPVVSTDTQVFVNCIPAATSAKLFKNDVQQGAPVAPVAGVATFGGLSLSVGDVLTATQTANGLESPESPPVIVYAPGTALADNFDGYLDQAGLEQVWSLDLPESALKFQLTTGSAASCDNFVYSQYVAVPAVSRLYFNLGTVNGTDAAPLKVTFRYKHDSDTTAARDRFELAPALTRTFGALGFAMSNGAFAVNQSAMATQYLSMTNSPTPVIDGYQTDYFNYDYALTGVTRTSGVWHKMQIVVLSNVVNFYIDDQLANPLDPNDGVTPMYPGGVPRVNTDPFHYIILGNGYSTNGPAMMYDDISVTIGGTPIPFGAPNPVSAPTVTDPLFPAGTTVALTDVDPTASVVAAYVDGVSAGTTAGPFPGGTASVTVAPLANNDVVTATQTVGGTESCLGWPVVVGVPVPTVQAELAPGQTQVQVSDIEEGLASQVTVYEDQSGTLLQLGFVSNPATDPVTVTVSALPNGATIVATQTIGGVESQPSAGVVVALPAPTVAEPIVPLSDKVTVYNVLSSPGATAQFVFVYVNNVYRATGAGGSSTVYVTTGALNAGDVVEATQYVNGLESPRSAPVTVAFSEPPVAMTWIQTSSLTQGGLTDPQAVYYNGYVYAVGGRANSATSATNTVFYAQVQPDGSIGPWQATTPLPQATAAHGADAYNGKLYVWGGWTTNYPTINTCRYATINPDGTIGPWTTSAVTIPNNTVEQPGAIQMDAFGRGTLIHNGVVYIINGEWDNVTTFGNSNSCYYSQIQPNGDFGPWNVTTPTATVNGSWFHGVCIIPGTTQTFLYRVAGNYRGTTETAMYRTTINPNGSLGTWVEDPANTPQGRYEHATAVVGQYLFMLCGLDGATPTNTVFYTKVNPDTGAVSGWRTGPTYPISVSRNAAVAYPVGDKWYILGVSGGPYAASGTRDARCYYSEVTVDTDGDNIGDRYDNCPGLANPDQADNDSDDVGNPCDNCPDDANPGQEDTDGDGLGDACDAPPVCRGDCNCDGNIGFADIDFFVAGIPNNEAAWAAKFPPPGPTCTFANCDVNGDGNVAFSDIDPFVAKIPSVCP